MNYLDEMNIYYETLTYNYDISMFNLLYNQNGNVSPLSARDISFTPLPLNHNYILEQFSVLSGKMPESANEVVLVTDEYHRVDQEILLSLGVDITEKVSYSNVIGKSFVSAKNDDYYEAVDGI